MIVINDDCYAKSYKRLDTKNYNLLPWPCINSHLSTSVNGIFRVFKKFVTSHNLLIPYHIFLIDSFYRIDVVLHLSKKLLLKDLGYLYFMLTLFYIEYFKNSRNWRSEYYTFTYSGKKIQMDYLELPYHINFYSFNMEKELYIDKCGYQEICTKNFIKDYLNLSMRVWTSNFYLEIFEPKSKRNTKKQSTNTYYSNGCTCVGMCVGIHHEYMEKMIRRSKKLTKPKYFNYNSRRNKPNKLSIKLYLFNGKTEN